MTEDGWAQFADLLGDGSIPVFGFRVVSFLNSDGHPEMAWERHGEQVTGGRALGDIMGAAFEMFHRHLHEHEE